MTELWISKRAQDAIFEYAGKHAVSYGVAERRFLQAINVVAQMSRKSTQETLDRIDKLTAAQFGAFIDHIRNL